VDEILESAWIEVEIGGTVVRRYVVFLCRRWYFWGGAFLVYFGRDVIFSMRCGMALMASSTQCHTYFSLLSDHEADELLCLD